MRGGNFANPTVLIETIHQGQIGGTMEVIIEGKIHTLRIAEVQHCNNTQTTTYHTHLGQKRSAASDNDTNDYYADDTTTNQHFDEQIGTAMASTDEPLGHNKTTTGGTDNEDPINLSETLQTETGFTNNPEDSLTLYKLDNHNDSTIAEQVTNLRHTQDTDTINGNLMKQDKYSGDTMGNWEYRSRGSASTYSCSSSIDYQAEALQTVDVSQSLHKAAQHTLCKGLFGLHIRRGRGQPKKYKTNPKYNKKEITNTNRDREHTSRHKKRNDNKQPDKAHSIQQDFQLMVYDEEKDKRNVAQRIYNDAMDKGLQLLGEDEEQAINTIKAAL